MSWRLDAQLFYSDLRTDWTTWAEASTTVPVEVPEPAYQDPLQQEWLSEVWVRAVGLDGEGRRVGAVALQVLWVVWADGPGSAPRWLDEAARISDAPSRAWSEAAKATVPYISPEDAVTSEFTPPRSTP